MSRILIDTEGFLVPAAKAAEYAYEWEPDNWRIGCRHDEAMAYFMDKLADIRAFDPSCPITLCFSSARSFRYGIWPEYKSNRKSEQKVPGWPDLVAAVKRLAISSGWDVVTLENVEADDALGILAGPDDFMASVDKDLLTVPGRHLRNGELVVQSKTEADLCFFTQALVGDRSDHYPGCLGIGDVKASKALTDWGHPDPAMHESLMWAAVLQTFLKAGQTEEYALAQARCARILRPGEYDFETQTPRLWNP
jgi:DNA polymerase-1